MAQGAIPAGQNDKVRVNSADTAPDFLDQKIVSSDGSVTITTSSCDCSLDLAVNGGGGFSDTWVKVTVDYTDFQPGAAGTVTINPTELTGVPAGTIVPAFKQKHSVAFVGGTISAATIGIIYNATDFSGLNVFQAPSGTRGTTNDAMSGFDIPDHDAVSNIGVKLILTGDTSDNLTAGSADIWINLVTLI